jgi:hypothetical protein
MHGIAESGLPTASMAGMFGAAVFQAELAFCGHRARLYRSNAKLLPI